MRDQAEDGEKRFEDQRADVFCLGMVLYRVLFDKFPFSPNCYSLLENNYSDLEKFLAEIWVVETEFFLRQGGMIGKLLAQLLLKCFYMDVGRRPFVEWLTVIFAEVKSSLECLY